MTREDIKTLAIRQANYLRNIDIKAVPFYPDDGPIGFRVKYKNEWLWYFYDNNGEVSIPQDDRLFDVAVKSIREIPDDNIQKSIEKAQRKHIERLVFGDEPKQSALPEAKLMYAIFGKTADRLAKRILDEKDFLNYVGWRLDGLFVVE